MFNLYVAQFSTHHTLTSVAYPIYIPMMPLTFYEFSQNCSNQHHKQIVHEVKNQINEFFSTTNQIEVELSKHDKIMQDSTPKNEKPVGNSKNRNMAEKNVKILEKAKKQPQNALRNILPNIIHQIVCFIQKQKRSGEVVSKYLTSHQIGQDLKFSIERFYCYQKLIKQKINRYLNVKCLRELNKFQEPKCEIYSQTEQQNFTKMNRILVKYFLEHELENIVLTSYRMKPQTRILNLKIKREILQELNDSFDQF